LDDRRENELLAAGLNVYKTIEGGWVDLVDGMRHCTSGTPPDRRVSEQPML